jgi:hypothetical protein
LGLRRHRCTDRARNRGNGKDFHSHGSTPSRTEARKAIRARAPCEANSLCGPMFRKNHRRIRGNFGHFSWVFGTR